MGISGFFNELNKEYDITKVINKDNRINCKYLILDFNAIIHNISQYVNQHINILLKQYLIQVNIDGNIDYNLITDLNIEDQISSFSPNNEDDVYSFFSKIFNEDFMIKLIYKKIQDYIIHVINNYCVTEKLELIYICIDGVPSKAKIITQRKRSYIGTFISNNKKEILKNHKKKLNIEPDSFNNLPYNYYRYHTNKYSFNKNFIKPATDFMIKLIKNLKSKEFFKTISSIGKIKMIIDGYENNGEAEHKFLRYIVDNNLKSNVCIHSPDADIIILLLNLQVENLNILRFNQQKSDLSRPFSEFYMEEINLDKLKNTIFDLIKSNVKVDDSKKNNFINDIAMLYSFFGNDFIEHLESVSVRNISYIPELYVKIYKKLNENLIIKTTKHIINPKFLLEVFKILSEDENKNLKNIIIKKRYNNIDKLKNKIKKYSQFYLTKELSEFDVIEFVEKYNNSRLFDLHKENKNIDKLLSKNILKRDQIDLSKIKNHDELSDKELLEKINISDNYLSSSDLFSNFINKNNGLIIIEKNQNALDNWYHRKKVEDFDDYEKEIYKLEQLLEEYLHYDFQIKLTSNISKYKSNFYKKFLPDPINEICENYIQMLVWIVDTYLNFEIKNGEYYKYHKAPFTEDIYHFLNNKYKFKNESSLGFNPTPLEHLLLVTPMNLNNLKEDLTKLLHDSYSDKTIENINDVILKKIDNILINDLFFKDGITIKCFDAKFMNNCHVFNENKLFDKYDEFISNFRKNIQIENQQPKTQIGGAKFIKYTFKMSEYKNKYYETRDIKYKELYKSYKRKINRLL